MMILYRLRAGFHSKRLVSLWLCNEVAVGTEHLLSDQKFRSLFRLSTNAPVRDVVMFRSEQDR
jgi:hypothetical protein